MKQEVEVAMRLVEKDSHDKQELVSSLRKQLEDVKNINIEMNSRLQVGRRTLLNRYDMHIRAFKSKFHYANFPKTSSLHMSRGSFMEVGDLSWEVRDIDHITGKSRRCFRIFK